MSMKRSHSSMNTPVQPEFSSLNLAASSDCAALVAEGALATAFPSKVSSESIQGRYVGTQPHKVDANTDELSTYLSKKKKSEHVGGFLESWNEQDHDLSKLAREARAIWKEGRPPESNGEACNSSYCNRMLPITATASSKIAASTSLLPAGPNKRHQSDPTSQQGKTHIEFPKRLVIRAEPAAKTHDAVLAAACRLLLQAPPASSNMTPPAPVPAPAAAPPRRNYGGSSFVAAGRAPAPVEEFSLGPGWSGA